MITLGKVAGMSESEILLRRLDGHLAGLRLDGDPREYPVAERLDAALRRLIAETASASAADRARVRAAVHYFVLRPSRGERRAHGGAVRRLGRDRRGSARPRGRAHRLG